MRASPPDALPDLVLYTSSGCHLCDEAREAIDTVLAERRAVGRPLPSLREVDIAADPELERAYREHIPVVTFAGERLELVIGARRLARLLERVLDGVPAP
jgi:hypothetical protein